MNAASEKQAELKILENEDKKMNLIMFIFLCVIPVVAFGFVILFNGGTMRDTIAGIMIAAAILIKIFEKPLGKAAKYAYISVIPVFGAIVIVMGNPGVYGAMVEAYFLVLFMAVLYYKESVVYVCAASTVAANVIAMIAFPDAYKAMNTITVWVFLWLVFALATVVAVSIVRRSRTLLSDVQVNEERVEAVLSSVRTLSDNLYNAGMSLSEISSNETASAEELSSTSQTLLKSSNSLRQKANKSMSNLNALNEAGAKLSENVKKVGETSDAVMKKSSENESVLNSLKSVNGEVIKSMEETNEVAAQLSDAVKGIDATLSLINDIAMQTNILSLNASIEAARAGAAGRGFAVVAHEVGNLAGSTQNSLEEIQTVMDRVRSSVASMTSYVKENNSKLELQNEYFDNVFGNMQEMNQLLRQSMEDISAMNEVHARQTDIIKHTFDINADIASDIETENKEFAVISEMVGSNTNDAFNMSEQVTVINDMVEKIDELLKKN